MRTVHAHFLDDLSVPRPDGKSAVPALYLSGNGPLVEVLQYALRGAGGGGKTFVRGVKDYLDAYVPRPKRIPPENLLVFDEAQRAFSQDKVREVHKQKWSGVTALTEPAHFIELCERMPDWSVLVGLIGTGQEIYSGEEGGLGQWRDALENCRQPDRWTVHAPAAVESAFVGGGLHTRWEPRLNLDTELRFHGAADLHELVGSLLRSEERVPQSLVVADATLALENLWTSGMRLWATRDLARAKQYLRDRYAEDPDARFGLLASSRDKLAPDFGVPNSWNETPRKIGPWFGDGEESLLSCRHLNTCMTEFGIQGLELDMALLAWGSDLVREGGKWDTSRARRYKPGPVEVHDPFQLRINAYRVLLTRGRDGTVVFVPRAHELDETWEHLLSNGFRELGA
jgi:hypothetical protein